MSKLVSPSILASVFLVLSLTTPAHALINRAWVSGHGTDAAGCGAPTSPCRSFQYVLNNIVAPGGEIDVLNPAGYGAMTIAFAVTIRNDGVGVAGVQQATTGQNAVTINAGPNDNVSLVGLTIEGLGVAQNGIQFNSGSGLLLANSEIFGFTGIGLNFTPNNGNNNFVGLEVSGGGIYQNGGRGVVVKPFGGALALANLKDQCDINEGVTADGWVDPVPSGEEAVHVNISDCTLNAAGTAVQASGPSTGGYSTTIDLDHAVVSNSTTGLSADGAHTVITANASTFFGITTVTSATNGGFISSFGNNAVYFYGSIGAGFSTQPLN